MDLGLKNKICIKSRDYKWTNRFIGEFTEYKENSNNTYERKYELPIVLSKFPVALKTPEKLNDALDPVSVA